nr:glycosyl transferase family 2 [uncultured Porphyromonas sp.]
MCNHTGIIVQARLGSTRLPQKMSRRFYAEDTLLSYLLKRLLKSKYPVYVATSTAEADKEIVAIAEELGIPSFRGSEQDVLQRFIDAASHFHLDKIIRVCADNPFISVEDLDLLGEMLDSGSDDYVCFKTSQGTPTIKTHYGFWGEGVTLNSLKNVNEWSKEKQDHEHVTIYIYSHPTQFQIKERLIPIEIEQSQIRLTIDTIEDFSLAQSIVDSLVTQGESFSPLSIVRCVSTHPEWLSMMQTQIKKNTK